MKTRHSARANWRARQYLKFVNKPSSFDDWETIACLALMVNALYEPNFFLMSMGILRFPFFEVGAPSYFNFGGIGTVVGHEITHGYFTSGPRILDENGKLVEKIYRNVTKAASIFRQIATSEYLEQQLRRKLFHQGEKLLH